MKHLFSTLLFVYIMTIPSFCYAQKKVKIYPIGDFKICPQKNVVFSEEMVGGTDIGPDGSVMHWDGSKDVRDPKINYFTTSLIVLGNFVTFKEYFPVKCDFNNLEVLRMDINYSELDLCVKDKKHLYTFNDGRDMEKINISKYKHITDCVFQDPKTDKIYFLDRITSTELTELTQIEHLDLESLQHIVANYYMDKNGLYFFGQQMQSSTGSKIEKWNDSGMLEKSNGKDIQPIVGNEYFIYNGSVYSTKDEYRVCKLDLDGTKLNEINLAQYGDDHLYITDGNTIYKMRGSDWAWEKSTVADIFASGKIDNEPGKWKMIGKVLINARDQPGSVYYFPSVEKPSGSGQNVQLLHAADGFYFIRQEPSLQKPVPTKMDSILIRNYDTKQYELLDINQYRHIVGDVYIYKNRLYTRDCQPIEEDIDLDQLDFISYRDVKTNFLWDGKTLLHEETVRDLEYAEENSTETLRFDRPTVKCVDIETLKVVNANILVDKNNIYSANYDGITVIPIKELKLKTRIIPPQPPKGGASVSPKLAETASPPFRGLEGL